MGRKEGKHTINKYLVGTNVFLIFFTKNNKVMYSKSATSMQFLIVVVLEILVFVSLSLIIVLSALFCFQF